MDDKERTEETAARITDRVRVLYLAARGREPGSQHIKALVQAVAEELVDMEARIAAHVDARIKTGCEP